MLVFGLGGFVSLVGEVDELGSGHVLDPRALSQPKTLGCRDEVWSSVAIGRSEGVTDERLCDFSDTTVEYILHRKPVSETYQTASLLSITHVLLPKQSVRKSKLAPSSSRSRSCCRRQYGAACLVEPRSPTVGVSRQ
jgi:hypothetical protein